MGARGEKQNSTKSKCRTCERQAVVRGLCRKCYANYANMLKRGAIQESTVVDSGVILPSRQVNKLGNTDFAKGLRKALGESN